MVGDRKCEPVQWVGENILYFGLSRPQPFSCVEGDGLCVLVKRIDNNDGIFGHKLFEGPCNERKQIFILGKIIEFFDSPG